MALPYDQGRTRQRAKCASHRLRYSSQRIFKSGFTLPMVSWEDARFTRTAIPMETLLVRSVEPIATPERVYNIRVAEDHNYFVNGVLVHNCDDPNNAMSGLVDLQATIDWFGKTWIPRQNDQEHGSMVVVGQRLDKRDLSQHILELGGWEHLNLPTEFEPARKCFTKIGWEDPRQEEGELLWPQKFPREVLDKLKRGLGSMQYSAQYQQLPVPAGGGMFQQRWFRYFEETNEAYILYVPGQSPKSILKSLCRTFGTIDLAISSKQTADYTVMCVWAITPEHDLLLLHVLRDRLSNAEQLQSLHTLNSRFSPDFWKVETVAYQLAFFQQALAEGIPCREFRPTRDKVSRASTASVWCENGKSYTRQGASWLPDWEAEHLTFPKGSHDDMVDNHGMAADEVCTPILPLQGVIVTEKPKPPTLAEIQKVDPFKYAAQHGYWSD